MLPVIANRKLSRSGPTGEYLSITYEIALPLKLLRIYWLDKDLEITFYQKNSRKRHSKVHRAANPHPAKDYGINTCRHPFPSFIPFPFALQQLPDLLIDFLFFPVFSFEKNDSGPRHSRTGRMKNLTGL
ncbi:MULTISPECIES: hypothetical protein [Sphingobacterium]|uniref:hypothetical protein n=1 Tax=Sphingobacterium TaxID=28453 RepID=UPI002580DBF0|nr:MULTISPECIES: hypothetical protein [Sphingobacterium]